MVLRRFDAAGTISFLHSAELPAVLTVPTDWNRNDTFFINHAAARINVDAPIAFQNPGMYLPVFSRKNACR